MIFLKENRKIVIKSLEQNYSTVDGLAGASILGDGSICLILDIASMITKVINEQDRLSREDRRSILENRTASVEKVATVARVDAAKGTDEKTPSAAKPAAPQPGEKVVVQKPASQPAVSKAVSAAETVPKAAPIVTPAPIVFEEPAAEDVSDDANAIKENIEMQKQESVDRIERHYNEQADSDEMRGQIESAMNDFKKELRQNVEAVVSGGNQSDHIMRALGISDSDLKRIQFLSNVGITNGAESLSHILNKRVDLSIPEVKLLPVEQIPAEFGDSSHPYVGVYMPLTGDMTGNILLSLPEKSAYDLIDQLYGMSTDQTSTLTEDGESAIKEITNIIGSSVVNAFSEKTNKSIMPDVPIIVHDYMQSILDTIVAIHGLANDYALVMDTEFYYDDDRVMGHLLILPETESLKAIVQDLRES